MAILLSSGEPIASKRITVEVKPDQTHPRVYGQTRSASVSIDPIGGAVTLHAAPQPREPHAAEIVWDRKDRPRIRGLKCDTGDTAETVTPVT